MNITPYTLDSLRKLVRALQTENKELKALLDKSGIPYAKSNVFEESSTVAEEYDIDQGGRIQPQYIDQKLAVRFFSMFWGREDVFAKRARNGNYYPQCENRQHFDSSVFCHPHIHTGDVSGIFPDIQRLWGSA